MDGTRYKKIMTFFMILLIVPVFMLSSLHEFEKNPILVNASSQQSSKIVSILGETKEDWSGLAVTGIGDFNNDGYDDFLISAPLNDTSGDQAGQIFLFRGRTNANWANSTLSDANASFLGEAPNDVAGMAISGAGDVNNDGFDDFIVGVPNNRKGGGLDFGQTYLILGRANESVYLNHILAYSNASFIGEAEFDRSGTAVSGVGDVNNDGYDDFVISSPFNNEGGDEAGQTYLIFGRATSQWRRDISLAQANASFIGEANHTGSGHAVAGVGDINSDGYDDFLISAPWGYGAVTPDLVVVPGTAPPGKTYIIFGRPTAMWQMDTNLSQVSASIIGEVVGDQFGYTVAGAGDVNNDSISDFLIGANWNNEGGNQAGQAYLFLGGSNFITNMSANQANASFIGESVADMASWDMAGVGDVDGDDFDDFLISAPGNMDGGYLAGKVYLIFGRANTQWSLDFDLAQTTRSYIGENPEDGFGNTVAGVGDVDGDGLSDFLIGAFGNDQQAMDAGKSYLILDVLPQGCTRRADGSIVCVTTHAFTISSTTSTTTTNSATATSTTNTFPMVISSSTTQTSSLPTGFISGFDVFIVVFSLFTAASILPRLRKLRKTMND